MQNQQDKAQVNSTLVAGGRALHMLCFHTKNEISKKASGNHWLFVGFGFSFGWVLKGSTGASKGASNILGTNNGDGVWLWCWL